jgi:hypothetical protein
MASGHEAGEYGRNERINMEERMRRMQPHENAC